MTVLFKKTGIGILSNRPIGIDWSNSLTIGLLGCWVPGACQYNLVDGTLLSLQDSVHSNPSCDKYGAQWAFDGANASQGFNSLGPTYLAGNTNFSMFAVASINTGVPGGDVSGGSFYAERAAAGNDIIFLGVRTKATAFTFVYRNDVGNLLIHDFGGVANDGIFHTLGVTKFGTGGGGNIIAYKDGVQANTNSWINNDTLTNAGLTVTLGYSLQDTTGNMFGKLALSACWNRVLTPVEISLLNFDPFQFLILLEEFEVAPLIVPPVTTVIYAFDQVGAHITRKITSLGY